MMHLIKATYSIYLKCLMLQEGGTSLKIDTFCGGITASKSIEFSLETLRSRGGISKILTET